MYLINIFKEENNDNIEKINDKEILKIKILKETEININKYNKLFIKNKTYISYVFLLFILLILIFLIKRKFIGKKNSFKDEDKNILEILTIGRNYINKCLAGELKTNETFKEEMNPIISIIIPVYNREKSIISCLRSCQNQNIENFEIILINDFSKDNTLQLIKEIKKDDNRIKVITNKKNMGTLYSRSIGVLQSKGKYIFPLDSDDLFFVDDILSIVYKEEEKGNYDIVEFRAIEVNNYYSDINKFIINRKNKNITLFQPELSIYPITKNGNFFNNDYILWGKSIKNYIYKKAVNSLGKHNYSTKICWTDDAIAILIISNIAESFKLISKIGIYHLNHAHSITATLLKEEKLFNDIFFLNIILEYTKNEFKYYSIYKALDIKYHYLKDNKFLNEKNKLYLIETLNKILDCQYISIKNKNKIRKNFKNLLN